MTTVLDRVPVDDITTQAREVRFGLTVLTLLAAMFYGLGWVLGKAWLGVAWAGVAVRTGWRESRVPRPDLGGG